MLVVHELPFQLRNVFISGLHSEAINDLIAFYRSRQQTATGAEQKTGRRQLWSCPQAGMFGADPGNDGRNNFPVWAGAGDEPRSPPLGNGASGAAARADLAHVTALLASVGRCSRPDPNPSRIRCFATTPRVGVERCSGSKT